MMVVFGIGVAKELVEGEVTVTDSTGGGTKGGRPAAGGSTGGGTTADLYSWRPHRYHYTGQISTGQIIIYCVSATW